MRFSTPALAVLSVGTVLAAPQNICAPGQFDDFCVQPLAARAITIPTPTALKAAVQSLQCAVFKDVVNAFASYTSSASAFCTSFLTTSTTTTLRTYTPTTTTTTTTPPAVTVTSVITETDTSLTATTTTAYVTDTAGNTYVKRGQVPIPSWIPAVGSQILSSACSCYITPPPTLTLTSTAFTSTSTSTSITEAPTPTVTTLTTTTTSTTTTAVQVSQIPVLCNVVGCFGNGVSTLRASHGGSEDDCLMACRNRAGCNFIQYSATWDDGSGVIGFCNLFGANAIVDAYAKGTSTSGGCRQFAFFDKNCPL